VLLAKQERGVQHKTVRRIEMRAYGIEFTWILKYPELYSARSTISAFVGVYRRGV